MLRRVVLLGIGVAMAAGMLGCDKALLKALPGDTARMISDATGVQAGDALMSQLQQRDQLQDGSCGGTCDGVPNPDAGAWQGAGGNGDAGDQLRLRDGSCEL